MRDDDWRNRVEHQRQRDRPQFGGGAGTVHRRRLVEIVRNRLQYPRGHGKHKREAKPGLHHNQRSLGPERVGHPRFWADAEERQNRVVNHAERVVKHPGEHQNGDKARHRPRQNKDGTDKRLKAQILLVYQNCQQYAHGTLQRGGKQRPDHRPLQHVEKGRAPDGQRENINEVLKPYPIHQLRRRRVVKVIVGKSDGETKQDWKNHHEHQQDEAWGDH